MLSIIIPTLNEGKYLPKLLECIKNQTYSDYEIVVADAGSKDRTIGIARKYGCKVVKGGMPSVGRHNGAKAAKGSLLLFLDADMKFDRNFLENSVEEMMSRKLDVAGYYLTPLSNKFVYKIFS